MIRSLSAVLSALALALPAAAQNEAATSASAGVSGAPSAAGAAVTATGAGATTAVGMTPTLSAPGVGLSPVSAAPTPVVSGVLAPSVAPLSGARAAVPSVSAPTDSAPEGRAAMPEGRAAAREGVRPSAGTALGGATRELGTAKAVEAAGGDELSVRAALDRAFDAQAAASALRASGGVIGRSQGLTAKIAQKVAIANTSAPSDAPGLYADAIKTAQDALPASAASAVARVVEGFAARKADLALGDLAVSAYRAAAAGDAKETGRQLSAFDKWESLLGLPGRPLVSNAAALKTDVEATLAKAQGGASPSVPHVWFARKGGAYVAVLPGSGVAAVPALAAAFALKAAALSPASALADAYRAFAADPRAASGAALVYRARRALGSSVPGAALSAARFWLRDLLASLWTRLAAFFRGGTSYDVSRAGDRAALAARAARARTARDEAAAAERLAAPDRLTVGGARAAFAALARSAAALDALSGGGDAASAVAALSASFESAASARGLGPGDAVPAGLASLVDGPGGLSHWAKLAQDGAARSLGSARLSGASGVVNLGAEGSPAALAAAAAKDAAGAPLALVALDEDLWARGRGAYGEVALAAVLRATTAGGSLSLSVERGDAALARRLSDLGFSVTADGAGLEAEVASGDFGLGADDLALVAARALAAATGAPEAAAPDAAQVRALAEAARRDPLAPRLAAALDGRPAFARARVIGLVGEYEALAAAPVRLGGRSLLVGALRDPATGLIAYARAARPDGAPLSPAELRALLPAR